MARESFWINSVLHSIKDECNKVRKVQHILSRKKHTSSTPPSQNYQSGKDADIDITFADSRKLTTQPSKTKFFMPKDMKFSTIYTNHMLKMKYDENNGGWQKPVISPFEEISLHPASKVFHYAQTMFEGMKAYRGIDEKIRLFRPLLNMTRFNITAERACLPQIDSELLLRCIEQLISIDQDCVPYNELSSLYIRPFMFATDPSLSLLTPEEALLCIILTPAAAAYFPPDQKSIRLLVDPKYVRAWPGGCGDKKMGSNYAPATYVERKAKEQNCDQVLWLFGSDDELTEAGPMNAFLYYINEKGERELATPPLSGYILPGIVRKSLLDLSKEWNEFNVVEKKITMAELIKLNEEQRLLEMFGTGTACVVCPVSEILYKNRIIKIPTIEHPNPIHQRFLQTLYDIQYGRLPHSWAPVIDVEYYNSYSKRQAKQ